MEPRDARMLIHPVFVAVFTLGALGAMTGIFLDLPMIKDLGFLVSLLSLGFGLAMTPTPVNRLDPVLPVHEPPRAPATSAPPAAAHPAPRGREEAEFVVEPVAPPPPARRAPQPAAPSQAAAAVGEATPVPAGYTRGKCSQCGTLLTLSNKRPIKARCPVCGHTKVLE